MNTNFILQSRNQIPPFSRPILIVAFCCWSAQLSAAPALLADQLEELLATPEKKKVGAAADGAAPARGWAATTPAGHVRFLSAPPGHHFNTEALAGDMPEAAALKFLRKNSRVLGTEHARSGVEHLKTKFRNGRIYVRFQQTVDRIPVFGAQINVQLDGERGVESLISDIERDQQIADEVKLRLTPTLTRNQATARVRALFGDQGMGAALKLTEPKLWIFAPSVLGLPGNLHLVWELKTAHPDMLEANQRVLLDAETGNPVRRYPLVHSILNRRVHDAVNTTANPGTLVRTEGQGPSGNIQVDQAYEFLGDTYRFYNNQHGRDSIDANGLGLVATVRYCNPGGTCPLGNAHWDPVNRQMYFGDGFAVDDVTAHELTHGVTDLESDLIYENASGAINESFSDIWGEFVDLGNGRGNDSAAVRWDIGEDLATGRIRSMSDPPAEFDPDRINGQFFVQPVMNPTDANDYGGVHANSGVNNKLCFLLVDGATFNGQTVQGMGISRVAELYYELQVNFLTAAADWSDMYFALQQGAINLGWSVPERNNLFRACQAVNVASPGNDLYVDQSTSCPGLGFRDCGAYAGPFSTVAQGVNFARPGDFLRVRAGSYNEQLTLLKVMEIRSYDGTVTIGQ